MLFPLAILLSCGSLIKRSNSSFISGSLIPRSSFSDSRCQLTHVCPSNLSSLRYLKKRYTHLGQSPNLGYGQRDDLDAQLPQNRRHFRYFLFVVGCKHEFHHRLSPMTLLCVRHRRAQPRFPRPSSFFSSLSVNGRPSPVPCTSINSPFEVITTLQSTIAWLSSA